MKDNNIFANRLKSLRHQYGLTQSQLAKQAGVHEDSIFLWENNRHKITDQKLNKLADFFNVSPAYLKGLTDDPRPPIQISTPAC